jgi:hypothetical protein
MCPVSRRRGRTLMPDAAARQCGWSGSHDSAKHLPLPPSKRVPPAVKIERRNAVLVAPAPVAVPAPHGLADVGNVAYNSAVAAAAAVSGTHRAAVHVPHCARRSPTPNLTYYTLTAEQCRHARGTQPPP